MVYFFGISIFLTSLFLILLILIQRGRGGGLAGAFGGMGGQSAFGTKAGDLFTKVTIGVATLWIVLSVGAIKVLNQSQSVFGDAGSSPSAFSPDTTSSGATGIDTTTGTTGATGTKDESGKTGDTETSNPATTSPGTPSITGGKSETGASASEPSTTKSGGTESTPPAAGTASEKPAAEAPDDGKK